MMLAERRLHRVQLAILGQTLDGRDLRCPAACTASTVQLFTDAPLTWTTQAPHWLVSQPTWVPVRSRCWRRKSTRSVRGSTSRVTAWPFTVMETLAIQSLP